MKHGPPAEFLQRNGLPGREHYERAFEGTDEVGLTAMEATDVKRPAPTSSVSSISLPPKHPHRATGSGSDVGLGSLLSTLVASRQSVRVPGASDLATAIADIQSRFLGKASEGQIDVFTDWIEANTTSVIRYNSSSSKFKERMF
ncbi:hypothetical protein B0J13DRAFT_532874 [Dactylonectria estremocensis]|uniref:Uncharacterized protein n=1 Tax=Dactylonectria estremocensis TaxID=1079267 RepID=A0A9P9DEZ0_9HYPO|nr:hypothetical protein B0J13DRAFT_532874 [Dactylonectria estremocensis]